MVEKLNPGDGVDYQNLKHPEDQVSFSEAVRRGLGRDQGLFFPVSIPPAESLEDWLAQDFVERSAKLLSHFVDDRFSPQALRSIVAAAFDFPLPVVPVDERSAAVELFHGPSLAFKDFGARFLAGCLTHLASGPTTILTATSGDTGAAVAHAFFGQPDVRAVILYPLGRISPLQEKLFCTLGGNVTTIAIRSDFDDCQRLVKQAFDDPELVSRVQLNSANSINVCRLLAQVCYYFEAVARAPRHERLVCAVPSGNFGNLTAGLMARTMGLPLVRLVAGTNANDTVPRYLATGDWKPNPTVATLTNAMDVAAPNNFPRVQYLADHYGQTFGKAVVSCSLDDGQTRHWMRALHDRGYVAEPHTALAYGALQEFLADNEYGLFLATAHPAKFQETVEATLGESIPLPAALAAAAPKPLLSIEMEPDFGALREILMDASASL